MFRESGQFSSLLSCIWSLRCNRYQAVDKFNTGLAEVKKGVGDLTDFSHLTLVKMKKNPMYNVALRLLEVF